MSDQQHAVEQFLFHEASILDDMEYNDWETLWNDDAKYWIPANGADIDPETQMSIIYDNRSRIALRVRQFYTGKRHTQMPESSVCHVISNVVIKDDADTEDLVVHSNAIVFESNLRGDTLWGCRNTHHLRAQDDTFSITYKKVVLTNNETALSTLSFII